jgi:hypothetical protein
VVLLLLLLLTMTMTMTMTTAVRVLSSGEVITDRVEAYNWKFYTISVPGGTHTLLFQVWTLESTAHGDCDLYIKKGNL